jgi:hypothetical protein
MVGQEVVLRDPSMGLFVVVVFFIPLRPDFIVVKLSNQKVDILTRVTHSRGSSPRFAKISNALFDPKKCSDMFYSLT